jgi:uncharacterized repeat protein (TIGR02543 family)
MKKIITYFLCAFLGISFLHAQEWYFETMFNSEGWVGVGETQINVENELLTAVVDHWEGPKINHTTLENITAADYTTLTISMANDAGAYHFNEEGQVVKRIRVFWVRDEQEQYTADQMILFEYYPKEDPEEFQEHVIDLTQHAGWTGIVWAIRLDLCYMGGKQVDIDYIILAGEAAPQEHSLTINIIGEGSVEVDGNKYTESVKILEGTQVAVKAIPAENYVFGGWSGGHTASETEINITMDGDISITATFTSDQTNIPEAGMNGGFSVFPNPASRLVNISGSWTKPVEMIIYSITGKLVHSNIISSEKHQVDVSELTPGMYFIRVENQVSRLTIQ